MERNIFVSIIIPTYRDWPRLQVCIDTLAKQTYAQTDFEVIIVNNDPNDKAPTSFKLLANCKLIDEIKPGSYAARNAGLEIAKGSIIGFTDSDCVPHTDWIESAVNLFTQMQDCGRIGGHVKMFYQTDSPNPVEIYDTLYSLRQKKYVTELGAAATANMFARRSVFDEVGPFNSSLMSGGDIEWGKRAKEKGFKIIFGEKVIVEHPARFLFKHLKTKEKRVSGGHFKLQDKLSGIFSLTFSLLKGLKPPFSEYNYIKSQDGLSTNVKMKIFSIRYRLQILSRYEKLKLAMGIQPERR